MKKMCLLIAFLLAGCSTTTKEDAISCLMEAGIYTDTVLILKPMRTVALCQGKYISLTYPLEYKRYSVEQRKYISGCVIAYSSSKDVALNGCFVSESIHESGHIINLE